jgi:integrase
MPRSYPEPAVPRDFACWILRTSTQVSVVDRRTGERSTRPADRWDVRGKADGVQFSKRFERAGLAQVWKEQLDRGFANGLPFDLKSRRFVSPESPTDPRPAPPATVFAITEAFYWANPDWEPKTKILAATAFNRARRWLLDPGAALAGADLEAVTDYLDHASFLPERAKSRLTDRQRSGRAWLEANSAVADDVTTSDLEQFLARFELNQRDPTKRVAPATLVRFTQPLRACWAWAASRDDIAVTRDPWPAVRLRRKVKGKTSRSTVPGSRLTIDTDLVLSIPQAMDLAQACVRLGSWGEIVECYVLVMAMCGLRPNEAVGLLWEDIELPSDGATGWLVVRRSRRRVAARWLDPEEDPEWGPLKDRDLAESRRVPINSILVAKLVEHRERWGQSPSGLVFHRNGHPFDLSVFDRDVWRPARTALFPPRPDLPGGDPRQPKLARLRRHDLRHAACSWWLRAGVDATVCQRWSGHKTLSVFLDVYQGVAPGREDEGITLLERTIADPVTSPVG